MGIILMRPLTSGVFQRLMAETFPEIDAVASDGGSGAAAAQLCALGPLRARSAGPRARFATPRAAVCGAEQRDLGRRCVAHRPGGAARSVCAVMGGQALVEEAVLATPESASAITVDWLRNALLWGYPGCEPVSVEVEPDFGGPSLLGRLARVRLSYVAPECGPSSIIVKFQARRSDWEAQIYRLL